MKPIDFTIFGELTQLNHYIRIERGNRFAAAKVKAEETARVAGECRRQHVASRDHLLELVCTWYTKNERKDADNVSFAVKFILDGMVAAGVIPNDSRKHTGAFIHYVVLFEDVRNTKQFLNGHARWRAA